MDLLEVALLACAKLALGCFETTVDALPDTGVSVPGIQRVYTCTSERGVRDVYVEEKRVDGAVHYELRPEPTEPAMNVEMHKVSEDRYIGELTRRTLILKKERSVYVFLQVQGAQMVWYTPERSAVENALREQGASSFSAISGNAVKAAAFLKKTATAPVHSVQSTCKPRS